MLTPRLLLLPTLLGASRPGAHAAGHTPLAVAVTPTMLVTTMDAGRRESFLSFLPSGRYVLSLTPERRDGVTVTGVAALSDTVAVANAGGALGIADPEIGLSLTGQVHEAPPGFAASGHDAGSTLTLTSTFRVTDTSVDGTFALSGRGHTVTGRLTLRVLSGPTTARKGTPRHAPFWTEVASAWLGAPS